MVTFSHQQNTHVFEVKLCFTLFMRNVFELSSVTVTWAADKDTHPLCKLKVGDVSLTSKCYTARLIVF